MWFSIFLMNMELPCNRRVLDGRTCFSKICMYLYQVTSQSTNTEPDDFCPRDQKLFWLQHRFPLCLGFNRASVQRRRRLFWSHLASSLHDGALVLICGWHGELCLQTVTLSPCTDFHDRFMSPFHPWLPEGLKIVPCTQSFFQTLRLCWWYYVP